MYFSSATVTITYVEPTVQRITIAKQGAAGTTLHRCGVLARAADSEYRSDELLPSSGVAPTFQVPT